MEDLTISVYYSIKPSIQQHFINQIAWLKGAIRSCKVYFDIKVHTVLSKLLSSDISYMGKSVGQVAENILWCMMILIISGVKSLMQQGFMIVFSPETIVWFFLSSVKGGIYEWCHGNDKVTQVNILWYLA